MSAIAAAGLTHRFGNLVAVNNLTFEVPVGGVVGLVGPSRRTRLGLIGLMLAVLTRSAALAIGIGIGFLLVVESLITIVASGASSYLPGGTLNALAAGGNHQLSWGAALGIAVVYGAIATTVSLLTFRGRDVTS